MSIQLFFKNINLRPQCKITIDDVTHYTGPVNPIIEINHSIAGSYTLKIFFTDKLPNDTKVDNQGNIIEDKNFELDQIVIDDYDIEELKWLSKYFADDGNTYESCLFFGPKGYFEINLNHPILPWILEQKHLKNNNDPNWKEDYNYYVQAWKILNQISQK
jgi:hypothetical protein